MRNRQYFLAAGIERGIREHHFKHRESFEVKKTFGIGLVHGFFIQNLPENSSSSYFVCQSVLRFSPFLRLSVCTFQICFSLCLSVYFKDVCLTLYLCQSHSHFVKRFCAQTDGQSDLKTPRKLVQSD